MMFSFTTIAPAASAAFLASLVEVVEAFTIILAVGTVRGWRAALYGAAAGFALLIVLVLAFGPLLGQVPLFLLQLVIGVLLLLFGLRWLRKAILRSAGYIALHDEEKAYRAQGEALEEGKGRVAGFDWIAAITSFKAVVLEGVEVVFIVIAVGATSNAIVPAALGAAAAALLVLIIGFAVHKPLSLVPENTLKFVVGILLSAFGIFWTGEGLGADWPGADWSILGFAALLLIFALGAVVILKNKAAGAVA